MADRFTVLANDALNDQRLSFRARGVLAYVLSKPNDWRTVSELIAAQSPREGRDAIRTALRELADAGYLVREKVQDPATGRWATISTIFEQPIEASGTNPPEKSAIPTPRKPTFGNPNPGQPGANQRTDSPRNETNHHRTPPRKRAAVAGAKSTKVVVGNGFDERLDNLAAACRRAGLPARWDVLSAERADAIAELLTVHGVDALVAHALRVHTVTNPTRFAGGLIGAWLAMPLPKAATAAKCSECENGWQGADYDVPCSTCRPNLARPAVAA